MGEILLGGRKREGGDVVEITLNLIVRGLSVRGEQRRMTNSGLLR